MNAIDFLLKEHDHVRKVLADIQNDSHQFNTKKGLFAKLAHELKVHEHMEEKVWYPRLQKNEALKDIIAHLIKEEQAAAKNLDALKKITDEIEWSEKFAEIQIDVLHHASEEENKLFPKVNAMMEESELKELGLEMFRYKQAHL